MNASKIRVKSTYAIRAENGELQRFRVTAVVQRRIDNTGSPHDYKSYVEGVVYETRNPELEPSEQVITLHPDRILGPYEEFVELTARREAEEAAAQAKKDAITANNLELRALLYQIVNAPAPNDSNEWRQLFRYSSTTIDISHEAVEPLLKALKALVGRSREEGGMNNHRSRTFSQSSLQSGAATPSAPRSC